MIPRIVSGVVFVAAARAKACCGVVNSGLAIYQGMIIAPGIDGRLQALNAETG
jgi:hypothetical protein